jgi:hypothetical protein
MSPPEVSPDNTDLAVTPPGRVSSIVSGVFVMLGGVLAIAGIRQPSFLQGTACCLLAAGLWIVWVRSFLIRLTGDELVVRSLFGGTRRIDASRIVDIGVRPATDLKSRLLSSGVEVAVEIADASTVTVNAAVFDFRELEALMARVRQSSAARRAALADPGAGAHRLGEGRGV